MIELIGVSVTRGATPLFRDLDLRIAPGEVFWVVGPNGAGKSSLLRVLAGIDAPAAGWVVRRPPDSRPRYMHSEMRIPGAATVDDWSRLARRLSPPDSAPGPALWPTVDRTRLVRRLSTGESKRLLLDVVLRLPGPLILDEPFEHLSPEAKTRLTERIDERARRGLVVVATNQATSRALRGPGLRLGEGAVVPLGASRARGVS